MKFFVCLLCIVFNIEKKNIGPKASIIKNSEIINSQLLPRVVSRILKVSVVWLDLVHRMFIIRCSLVRYASLDRLFSLSDINVSATLWAHIEILRRKIEVGIGVFPCVFFALELWDWNFSPSNKPIGKLRILIVVAQIYVSVIVHLRHILLHVQLSSGVTYFIKCFLVLRVPWDK